MRHTIVILAAAFALAGVVLVKIYVSNGTAHEEALYLRNINFHLQTELYELYKGNQHDVVMLGNSLTQWVDWNELLGRRDIANRGIASDVTEGYLNRMQYVVNLRPKICFIEGGINDIYAGVTIDQVYSNILRIVDTLQAHNIIPVIQSTLYVSPKWRNAAEKNPLVRHLNTRLKEFTERSGIIFLDLNAVLSAGEQLRDEYTYDGVHLNASGYALWGKEVAGVLREHGL